MLRSRANRVRVRSLQCACPAMRPHDRRKNQQPASPRSLLASAVLCFSRGSFASSRCLLNSKVFELRTGLELLSQPDGLRPSACPGVTLLVAIFDGHLFTLQPAPSAAPYSLSPKL